MMDELEVEFFVSLLFRDFGDRKTNTKTHFRIKFQVTNFSQVLIQKSRPSGSRLPHYHQIKSNTTKPINQVSTHYRKIF